jgi:hypothetical protein
LAGAVNRLRDYAYPMSQVVWARRSDRAHAQSQADAELERIARGTGVRAGSAHRRAGP